MQMHLGTQLKTWAKERISKSCLQHRKYARLKKIFNIGEKLKPLGFDSNSADDQQSQSRDQPDEGPGAVPQAEHITQDQAHTEAINRNLKAAGDMRDLYIQVQI